MKEELQQIQAVAITTFLLIILSVHNSGEYGEWFEVSGMKEEINEFYDMLERNNITKLEYNRIIKYINLITD